MGAGIEILICLDEKISASGKPGRMGVAFLVVGKLGTAQEYWVGGIRHIEDDGAKIPVRQIRFFTISDHAVDKVGSLYIVVICIKWEQAKFSPCAPLTYVGRACGI